MTHQPPEATLRPARSPASSGRLAFTALLGDRSRLRSALVAKRSALARLEAAWVAAAEADIAPGRGRGVHMDDRATWGRATWDRYLAAASKHEPDYMPRIRRLLGEIENVEKLLALPGLEAVRAA